MNNTSFKMVGNKTLEILFYGEIGDEFDGITAKQFADALKPHASVPEIYMMMNSIGGSAYEGAAIYNTLLRHKARKIIDIDGVALSAASLVMMAGDERRMSENALVMIHEPWGVQMGTASEMRAQADKLDKLTSVYAETYAKHSGQDSDDIRAIMHAETWFTAEEAIEGGFATEMIGAKRIAARAVPPDWYKRTPARMIARDGASTDAYREKLKQITSR